MRRPVALLACVAFVATACATPRIELRPVYVAGTERTYHLRADTTITIDVAGDQRVEHTSLVATSIVEILGVDGTDARVRLTLRPERFERDGAPVERAEQQVELVVAPDGSVKQIKTVGGLPADLSTDVSDLAPLLGVPLPADSVRLGDRWDRSGPTISGLAPSRQSGVVSALRVEHGYDTVILRVGIQRPLTRSRAAGERTISLSGTEYSSNEIAYAFRDGFPVRIGSNTEGRFTVSDTGGGDVTIQTQTLLELAPQPAGS